MSPCLLYQKARAHIYEHPIRTRQFAAHVERIRQGDEDRVLVCAGPGADLLACVSLSLSLFSSWKPRCRFTWGRILAGLDSSEAVLKLVLGAVELREGLGEVLELLVELLLDLGELLGREGVEVDCRESCCQYAECRGEQRITIRGEVSHLSLLDPT